MDEEMKELGMKSPHHCVIPVYLVTVPRSDAEDVKAKWQ